MAATKDELKNIQQLHDTDNEELAFMMFMACHGCQYKIFGTLSTELNDDLEVQQSIEHFFLIEKPEDLKIIPQIKSSSLYNPQRKLKAFIFDIQDKILFEFMKEDKASYSAEDFVKYIKALKPKFFNL